MRRPDVEAEISLRPTAEGGRAMPATTGYRPEHRILNKQLATGVHEYVSAASLDPGCSAFGTITFLIPEAHPRSLDAGDMIEVLERGRLVGHARILRVLNPVLRREKASTLHGADLLIGYLPADGWAPIDDEMNGSLVAELAREVSVGHVLFERPLRAIARGTLQDDVLFEALDGDQAVYLVHLTWRVETEPTWPTTTRFKGFVHFLRDEFREDLDA